MNKLNIIFLLILPYLSISQVIIGDEMLPSVNDTIYLHKDNIPQVNPGGEGGNKYWDFSSLSSGLAEKKILINKDPRLIQPDFNFDFILDEGNNIIRLYKKTGKSLFEVAVQRPHPMNSDYIVFSEYKNKKLIRYSDMKYGEEKSNSSVIYFEIPGDKIPELLKKKLPIKADSLRVKVEEIQYFHNDAWGTLRLYHNSFEVLRQYQNTMTNTSVEVFAGGEWVLIDRQMIDPNGSLLKRTSAHSYEFFANNSVESIAKIDINLEGEPVYAEFKASPILRNVVNITNGQTEYIISPNPSYGDIKLELLNAQPGKYNFEIYNVIGKRLWEQEISIDKKLASFRFDFSFLGKGTYLWTLTNEQGVRITTKRMVIITP